MTLAAHAREGRPDKLTPRFEEAFFTHILAGAPIKDACQAAGVYYATLRRWLTEFCDNPAPEYDKFREFRDRFAQVMATFKVGLLKQWVRAMPSDWKAIRDYMARRWPQEWGGHVDDEAAGRPLVPVTIQFRYRPEGYDPGAEPSPEGGTTEVAMQVGHATGSRGGGLPPPAGQVSATGLVEVDGVPPGMEPSPFTRFVTREL